MRLNELMDGVRKEGGKCSHMGSGRAYVEYTGILRSFSQALIIVQGAIIREKAWLG